jgi:hypothetical protein
MAKRIPLAILGILVLWQVLDYIIHVVILGPSYAATQQFWRPEDEMKYGLMLVVGLISATLFVIIYARLIGEKTASTAVKYGLLLGLCFGISMGYGAFPVMPIPYFMAFTGLLALSSK